LHRERIAGVLGDDVLHLREEIAWEGPVGGDLLGAHAYLGTGGLIEAIDNGADVVVTGRVADSALFAAELAAFVEDGADAFAGATAVGHLLECSGQITGGNFEAPGGEALTGAEYAELGYPLADVMPDGSAETRILDGMPGRVDTLTCTLQLLYEVHDPAAYVTPDAIIDFTGVRLEHAGPNCVRVSGARSVGRPARLKVSGFVERPGAVADVEIAYAGTRASSGPATRRRRSGGGSAFSPRRTCASTSSASTPFWAALPGSRTPHPPRSGCTCPAAATTRRWPR
jgi:acyclic terpene utilization AtuA family protein